MVSDKRKLAGCQEHNIPSLKSLAKTEMIVVLRYFPIKQTQKEK
jgi:hypothetical protein